MSGSEPARSIPSTRPKLLTTWGWSAIEIALQDLDKLYTRLQKGWLDVRRSRCCWRAASLARRLAGDLCHAGAGLPAGEVLYLTANTGDRLKTNHPEPKSLVDRPFIAVLAGPDLAKLKSFYIGGFHMGAQGDLQADRCCPGPKPTASRTIMSTSCRWASAPSAATRSSWTNSRPRRPARRSTRTANSRAALSCSASL